MREKTLYLTMVAIIMLFGACSNEVLFNENGNDLLPERGRTISLIATMPDGNDDDPATRVSLTQEPDNSISLTWEETDQLHLAFVQGDITRKGTATVKNISANKKQAHLDIVLPEGIAEDKTFDLYGVYGGVGLSSDNVTHAILPSNKDNGSLASLENNKHVMLYFSSKNIDATTPQDAVNFKHLGSLFSITLKNTGITPLNDLTEAQLVAVNNESGWAYNTGVGGGSYDLLTGEFTGTSGDFISFNAINNTLESGEAITFWGWYPPSSEVTWPALNLKVIASSTEYTTTVSKPARNSPTAVGGTFYLFAEWTGSEVKFTDDSFEPIGSLFVNKKSLTFEKAGGNETINITASEDWVVTSSESWLTVTPENGTNNGVITAIASTNRREWREANIIITNADETITKTVSVIQNGFATDLFFSEYLSGTSSNYYVEIYNGTGQTVDLSRYSLRRYSPGNTSPSFSSSLKFDADDTDRFLEHGKVYVVKNSAASLYEGKAGVSGAVYLPGDATVVLFNMNKNSIADIIGRIGENPGNDGWTVPGTELTTKRKTLVRKSWVRGGVTENPTEGFPTLSTEWISYPMSTIKHLGSHTMDDMTVDDAFVSTLNPTQKKYITTVEDEILYHEYFEMVNQIPLIDTKDFYTGDTGLSYSDFLTTLDAIDCQKDIIANVRGYDIMGLTIGDIETKPVIFLFNQHGSEHSGVHTLREFAKFLTTSQDVRVKYLRENVAFYIIPTVAAWNYDNKKYLQPNGVNLNRNWDNNWEISTDETKGTKPWSEPEVVVVRDKILALKPFLMVDTHHSSSPGLDVSSLPWRSLMMAIHDSVEDIPSNPTQYWALGQPSTASGWGHHQIAYDGRPMVSTTFETDGGADRAASINHGINTLHRLVYMATKLRIGN